MNIWTALARYANFETQRLSCRPVIFADSDVFFQLVSDPDNARFILPVTTDRNISDSLLVSGFMQAPLGVWALTDRSSGAFMGLIRLEKLSSDNSRAELGYLLSKAHWGQGYMTEAVKALSFLAFHELGLTQLMIVCHEANRASQRVAEKAGFQLLNRYKGSDRYSHKISTYLTYHLTRRDYRYE